MALFKKNKKDSSAVRSPRTPLIKSDKAVVDQTIKKTKPSIQDSQTSSFLERIRTFLQRSILSHAGEILLAFIVIAALTAFVYALAQPQRYDLSAGDVSAVDITSSRDLVDAEATNRRAEQAANNVPFVSTRSQDISEQSVERVRLFYALVDEVRTELIVAATPKTTTSTSKALATPVTSATTATEPSALEGGGGEVPSTGAVSDAQPQENTATVAASSPLPVDVVVTFTPEQIETYAQTLIRRIKEELNMDLELQDASMLVSIENSFYQSIKEQSLSLAKEIMNVSHDRQSLRTDIEARVTALTASVNLYKNEYASVGTVLSALLKENVTLDLEATERARDAEAKRILNSPSMIPAGTRIVNVGDVITEKQYTYLEELNLISKSGIQFAQLFQIFLLVAIVLSSILLYLNLRLPQKGRNRRDWLLVLITVLVTFLVSAFLSRFSVYAIPIYFLAILLSMHFDFEISFTVTALVLLALIPFISLPGGLFSLIFGVFCIALTAAEISKMRSNAWLIVISLLSPSVMVFVYGLLAKNSYGVIAQNMLIASICGGLCAVAALGLQPLVEMLSSSVSATHLIKLAQPSQPLLRRLFLEAPGTYQHSMMVANLAEKAAEVVGADSLLVRVGAYYHDIGKMAHPEIFTENQTDYNPHDYLSPEESVALIIGHVEEGVRTARRHRLPLPLQNFIKEHHGNTLQASFYYKAVEEAEKNDLMAPNEADYRYPWSIPSSRETAIVMLADSLEAAIRSTQTKDLAGAEKVARNIVKIKNEQNQLLNSGLSYQEVEKIILSFVQTYQGQFHERVRYPDARPISKHAKQIQPEDLQK